MFNQFWLHSRIDAMRAAGDERPLRTLLVRRFPATVAIEVVLALAVVLVAPFLHGSARNQAFQAGAAEHSAVALDLDHLSKLAKKDVSAATWIWGTGETLLVLGLMIGAYLLSGSLARRRASAAVPAPDPAPAPTSENLVEA